MSRPRCAMLAPALLALLSGLALASCSDSSAINDGTAGTDGGGGSTGPDGGGTGTDGGSTGTEGGGSTGGGSATAHYRMLAARYGGSAQAIYEWSSRTASWSQIASTNAWSGPIYSKDGQSVIGASIDGIGIVGLGGGRTRIIGLPGDNPHGVSPDGNEVIFSAYGRIGSDGTPAFPWLLWSVQLDSGAATQLTRGIGPDGIETRDDFGGAYLPDGSATIIQRRSPDFSTILIARLELTGNTVTALITPPLDRVYLGPSLDALGERITFLQCTGTGAAYDQSSCEVMVAAVDGTGVRQVTSRPASRGWPSFTPDGASLIVGEGETLGESRLMLVDEESGSEIELTHLNDLPSGVPASTPQGRITLALVAD